MLLKNPIHLYYRCDVFFKRVELMKQLYTSITCNCNAFIFSLNCNEDCLHLNNVVTLPSSMSSMQAPSLKSVKNFLDQLKN